MIPVIEELKKSPSFKRKQQEQGGDPEARTNLLGDCARLKEVVVSDGDLPLSMQHCCCGYTKKTCLLIFIVITSFFVLLYTIGVITTSPCPGEFDVSTFSSLPSVQAMEKFDL